MSVIFPFGRQALKFSTEHRVLRDFKYYQYYYFPLALAELQL